MLSDHDRKYSTGPPAWSTVYCLNICLVKKNTCSLRLVIFSYILHKLRKVEVLTGEVAIDVPTRFTQKQISRNAGPMSVRCSGSARIRNFTYARTILLPKATGHKFWIRNHKHAPVTITTLTPDLIILAIH